MQRAASLSSYHQSPLSLDLARAWCMLLSTHASVITIGMRVCAVVIEG